MSGSDKKDVEIFHRINKLKLRAGAGLNDGPGKLDPASIDRANSVVQSMSALYPKEIKNVLKALDKEWDSIKGTEDEGEKVALATRASNTANQIKDLAGTFGYTLMEYFGKSLRDYILKTNFTKPQQFTIIQAHIDVMNVAYRENLKNDDGGAAGEELKKMVQTAIDKYG